MTVSTTTIKNSYSANGSLTAFAYTFKAFAASEIKVYVRVDSTGVETLRTEGTGSTNYSVTGVGNAGGGTVTFVTAPASGETVVIRRLTNKTQTMDLVENDPFPAETFEDSLDKLTHQAQEVQEELDRAIKLSKTNTISSAEITTTAAARANKLLAFDADGELDITQEIGTFRGNWSGASTAYVVRDVVKDTSNNNIYICVTAHTSSGSQPISTNTDAAKWSLIVDAASATTSAQLADDWAVKTSGVVESSEYSAKAYALGGTGVTTTSGRGAAKEWATSTGAAVDTAEYSAKEYAIGTTVATGSAKDWAQQAEDSAVSGGEFSAKHYSSKSAASSTAATTAKTAAETAKTASETAQAAAETAQAAASSSSSSASTSAATSTAQATISTTKAGEAAASATAAAASSASSTTAKTAAETAQAAAETAQAAAASSSSSASTSATNAAASANAAEAAAAAIFFEFETSTTMANPSSGGVRFNHASVGSVTQICFSATSASTGNPDVSDYIVTWDDSTSPVKGHLVIRESGAPGSSIVFSVSGSVTDNTTHLIVPVTHTSSAGVSLSASDDLYFSFSRTGNKGADGAGSGDLLAANNLSDVANAGTALTNLGAAPAAGSSNIVTTGALNAGSITSGFGSIDVGASAITTTGTVSAGDVSATGDVTIGDDLHLDSDSAVLKFGDDAEVSLEHVHNAGLSLNANLYIPDNKSINIGTSNDLSLSHDGTNSHIVDQGTGDFFVKTNGTGIKMQTYSGENLATFSKDGAVELYHDNSKVFESVSGGVEITGVMDADNIKINGAQGSDGQILTSTGSGVAWEDAGGGSSGPFTAIASGSTSNGIITLTGVTLHSFLVQVVMTSGDLGQGGSWLKVYFSTNNGSSWITSTNYRYASHKANVSGHTMEYTSASAAHGILGLTGSQQLIHVDNMPNASTYVMSHCFSLGAYGTTSYSDAGTRLNYCDYTTAEAHNAVKFDWNNANVDLDYVVYTPA